MNIVSKKDYIWIVDNAIPEMMCDDLIKIFEKAQEEKRTYNRLESENSTATSKKDESLGLRTDTITDYDINVKDVMINLKTVFLKYCEEYDINSYIPNLEFDIAKIQKTVPGGGYHVWHVEKSNSVETANRSFVYTIYLNEDFEGGETEFLFQNIRCAPKKGRVCIFPANFPYLHRGNPPLTGQKYIVTSWIRSKYRDQ